MHYRCVVTERARGLAAAMARHGVGVRVLGRAHGAGPGMLRMLAPLPHQRATVRRAIGAVARRSLSAAA